MWKKTITQSTSDMRNLSEKIISDVMLKYQNWQHWYQQVRIKGEATGAIASGPPLQGGPRGDIYLF